MWKVIQCAVVGRSHIKKGLPCQDKTYSLSNHGVYVIALADGAGSAQLSHYGASRVTEAVCRNIRENISVYLGNPDGESVKEQILTSILSELDELASEIKCDRNDLASTLLFAAVADNSYLLGHIGDGVIGYMKNGRLKVATKPENGEFVNTTIFVTSSSAMRAFRLIKGQLNSSIEGFVLMSDGSESSFYDKRKKKLSVGLEQIMNLTKFLEKDSIEGMMHELFLDQIRANTMDDCSMIIIVNNLSKNLFESDYSMQAKILRLDPYSKRTKSRIKFYLKLISFLMQETNINALSREFKLNNKIAKKYVCRLIDLNLIKKCGEKYVSIVCKE